MKTKRLNMKTNFGDGVTLLLHFREATMELLRRGVGIPGNAQGVQLVAADRMANLSALFGCLLMQTLTASGFNP